MKRVIEQNELKTYLNGNEADRIEINHFLELVGFSRTFPIDCIIRSSDIERYVRMNANERYQLIRNVTGIDQYEKYKTQCERILAETDSELRQIDFLLKKINVQIEIYSENSFVKMRENLIRNKKFLENQSRLLMISNVKKSFGERNKRIQAIETELAKYSPERGNMMSSLSRLESKLKSIDNCLVIVRNNIELNQQQYNQCENEIAQDKRAWKTMCLQIEGNESAISLIKRENDSLDDLILHHQSKINKLNEARRAASEECLVKQTDINELNRFLESISLNCEQNKCNGWTFKNTKDRNKFLREKISYLGNDIEKKSKQLQRVQRKLEDVEKTLSEVEIKKENLQTNILNMSGDHRNDFIQLKHKEKGMLIEELR